MKKTGKQGIPQKDLVNDVSIYVDEYVESGKKYRLGHAKIAHQTNNALNRIAPELKISKSMLTRSILESFVKFYDEAKAVGGERFFEPQVAFDAWLQERYHMKQQLKTILEQNKIMNDNSKSPEIKMLSQQLTTLAKMINLTHKKLL